MNDEKLKKELDRLAKMREYENKFKEFNICGIDEAGRGPLAGPVVAGACVLPKDVDILYLNDSKKLSEKRREEVFLDIKDKALAYGIGIIDEKRIDEINILEATYEAMKVAYMNADKMLKEKTGKNIDFIFVDGDKKVKGIDIKQACIVKGDALSVSIAAGSILAKVTRDHMMIEYDKLYPEFGFAEHKGYGTKDHMQKLRDIGPCDIHRKSFLSFLNN